MSTRTMLVVCAIWGIADGAIAGGWPGQGLQSAIGLGLVGAATGFAFGTGWLGPSGVGHGFIVGGVAGALYGIWRPYQTPPGVTRAVGAVGGALALGVMATLLAVTAVYLGRAMAAKK